MEIKMKLAGKKIVITGASCGIGYELAKLALAKGCKVLGVARAMAKAEISHPNFFTLDMDISSPKGVDKVFDYALEHLGKIDIFVANAGYAFYEKLGAPDWQHYHTAFDLNVFSPFYSAQKMKQLYQKKPYSVLITASAMGYVSLPGYSMYSASKAALRGFADAYRYELAKGQKLQVVFPIATKTDFFRAAGDIPMSWPVQSATSVAKKIVRGLERGSANIFPSAIFLFFKVLSAIFPTALRVYNIRNNNAFKAWLAEKDTLTD